MKKYILVLALSYSASAFSQTFIDSFMTVFTPAFLQDVKSGNDNNVLWSACLGMENTIDSRVELVAKIESALSNPSQRDLFLSKANYYFTGSYGMMDDFFGLIKGYDRKKRKPIYNYPEPEFTKFKDYITALPPWKEECDTLSDTKNLATDSVKFDTTMNETIIKFLVHTIRYPQMELDNDIQGKVLIEFILDESGYVCSPKIKRKVSPGLDLESLRVIKLMPRLKPATIYGKPVKITYTLPVVFKLQ